MRHAPRPARPPLSKLRPLYLRRHLREASPPSTARTRSLVPRCCLRRGDLTATRGRADSRSRGRVSWTGRFSAAADGRGGAPSASCDPRSRHAMYTVAAGPLRDGDVPEGIRRTRARHGARRVRDALLENFVRALPGEQHRPLFSGRQPQPPRRRMYVVKRSMRRSARVGSCFNVRLLVGASKSRSRRRSAPRVPRRASGESRGRRHPEARAYRRNASGGTSSTRCFLARTWQRDPHVLRRDPVRCPFVLSPSDAARRVRGSVRIGLAETATFATTGGQIGARGHRRTPWPDAGDRRHRAPAVRRERARARRRHDGGDAARAPNYHAARVVGDDGIRRCCRALPKPPTTRRPTAIVGPGARAARDPDAAAARYRGAAASRGAAPSLSAAVSSATPRDDVQGILGYVSRWVQQGVGSSRCTTTPASG